MTAKEKTVKINILETTDVHGYFFPWDFTNKRDIKGTLARAATYIKSLRQQNPDGVILLDNGDILQGQPINYYYNFIATNKENIAASCINYLQYDAETWGNHDVEPGHDVFDKWTSEVKCPMIGANIIDTKTGKPYLKPYTIINRKGVKIAVIGMLTPAIPNWLPERLWNGLCFEEMTQCATKWLKIVKEQENPAIIVGLFHSGRNGGIVVPEYGENVSEQIAREVPGFDIIMCGHDHSVWSDRITSADGSSVVVLNPSNNSHNVAEADITITMKGKKVIGKQIEGKIIDVRNLLVDDEYMKYFENEVEEVKQWADRQIGTFEQTITTRDCFFGSSAFTDLVLNLQLKLTGADIALSAPLQFDATIEKGPVTISDMFNLYKFENALYVMRLSGKEIRKHLEMSYDLWVNTMTSRDDHIMQLDFTTRNNNERAGFKNLTFNFDSAAGIDYEVDVTKPDGEKVRILQMSDGTPFDEEKIYNVALNSYRANGGGELLTKGAGIPHDELNSRITFKSDTDLRHYLMYEIERIGTLNPQPNNNWRFVPDEWAIPALKRDRKLLYNE